VPLRYQGASRALLAIVKSEGEGVFT